MKKHQDIEALIADRARPLTGSAHDLDPLIDRLKDARFVLLGEASHGTHEFYAMRAEITRRLIDRHGFKAMIVEADWPDAYRVNRYIQWSGDDSHARDALADFERFPRWMWRNEVVLELIDWMRARNADWAPEERAGFYGFDLYSLHRSMDAVVEYLDAHAPQAAGRARERYSCFDHFGPDSDAYALGTAVGGQADCEEEVLAQLVELAENRAEILGYDGHTAEDEFFFAEQNARVAKNAEEYYRSMYPGRVSSWNLRDQHMAETATSLLNHFERLGRAPKAIIWAHNSHLGDARATSMGRRGEHNVGQLLRQRYGDQVVNVGFTTHRGTVTAASNWGEPPAHKRVRPGLDESFEALFHRALPGYFLLDLQADPDLADALAEPRLERAIGVIYRPETERSSHYFHAALSEQFDWVIHLDQTRALTPLDPHALWLDAHAAADPDLPETYPFGL